MMNSVDFKIDINGAEYTAKINLKENKDIIIIETIWPEHSTPLGLCHESKESITLHKSQALALLQLLTQGSSS